MKFAALKFTTYIIVLISQINFASAQVVKREHRMKQSADKINRVFNVTKTVCVGRFLLDVPANATVVYGPANVPYDIKRYPEMGSKVTAIAAELAREAVSKKSIVPIGPASSPGSKVGTIVPGFSDNNKIVYGVEAQTGGFYSLQSVVVVGSDLYIQQRDYYGDPSQLETVETELKSIAANILARDTESLPTQKGVCIDGAFVLDNGNLHHERTTVGVRMPGFDDVHFAVDMTMKDRLYDSDALEPRLKSAEVAARQNGQGDWYSRIKFLRRTERQIANWKGYEALARRPPQQRFRSVHEFSFVSQGEPNDPMLPVLELDFYTGMQGNALGRGSSSLNDVEAVELWDRLTHSIRPITPASK